MQSTLCSLLSEQMSGNFGGTGEVIGSGGEEKPKGRE